MLTFYNSRAFHTKMFPIPKFTPFIAYLRRTQTDPFIFPEKNGKKERRNTLVCEKPEKLSGTTSTYRT